LHRQRSDSTSAWEQMVFDEAMTKGVLTGVETEGGPPLRGLREAGSPRTRDLLAISLTVVTGITDAIGFLRLGGVFTSVMTGNLVLLGISGGRNSATLATHTGIAFVAFVIGSILGAHVAGPARSGDRIWPNSVTIALALEFLLFGAFAIGWEGFGGKPPGGSTLVLLGVNAAALGIQSAAVLRFGISGLSTTYLTGTLTTVIAGFTTSRKLRGLERGIIGITMLVFGALVGALLTVHLPRFAPVAQLVILGGVISIARYKFWCREPKTSRKVGIRKTGSLRISRGRNLAPKDTEPVRQPGEVCG
jgi:uncharacterized membrane protein YoaK (UPF0700 family)